MDENQCRTCLGEANDSRLSVFRRMQDSSIDEMLFLLTNVKPTQDDNFSKVLCKKCFNDTVNAFTFRKKVLNTERTLRGLEKKLLEMTNPQVKDIKLKHEDENPEETYEEQILKEELIQNDDSTMKLVYYETQDGIDELTEESYITYELEENEEATETAYIEEYEQVEYLESDINPNFDDVQFDESQMVSITCEYCKPLLTFKSELALEKHMFEEHQIGSNPFFCETCNTLFPIKPTDRDEIVHKKILKHMRYHLDGRFKSCNKCFEVFKTQKQLENHEKSHSQGSTQYKCKACGLHFPSHAILNEHVLETPCKDAQEKSFKCYICDQVFSMGVAKKRHIKEEHGDKAGADCPLCLRCKIPSAIAFENHYRTHFVEPRFSCSFCGRSFHESDRLQTHIRRSHDKNQYICFWCEKPFYDKSGIARHILGVHFNARNYKCSICSKAFTARYNLKEHMFSVHKVASRVYKCELCGQDFLYRKQYVRHRSSCVGHASDKKKIKLIE